MCQYHLNVCPYPHDDPIASTVFDFAKYSNWKLCGDPRPWGRLSCGNLSIHHSLPKLNRRHKSSDLDKHVFNSELRSPYLPDRHNNSLPFSIPDITNTEGLESPPDHLSTTELATSSDSPPSLIIGIAATPENLPKVGDISPSLSAKCEWCTIVLKAVSYKSIAIQNEAKQKMEIMEDMWDRDDELRELHKTIEEREKELDTLRQDAWALANNKLMQIGLQGKGAVTCGKWQNQS